MYAYLRICVLYIYIYIYKRWPSAVLSHRHKSIPLSFPYYMVSTYLFILNTHQIRTAFKFLKFYKLIITRMQVYYSRKKISEAIRGIVWCRFFKVQIPSDTHTWYEIVSLFSFLYKYIHIYRCKIKTNVNLLSVIHCHKITEVNKELTSCSSSHLL